MSPISTETFPSLSTVISLFGTTVNLEPILSFNTAFVPAGTGTLILSTISLNFLATELAFAYE